MGGPTYPAVFAAAAGVALLAAALRRPGLAAAFALLAWAAGLRLAVARLEPASEPAVLVGGPAGDAAAKPGKPPWAEEPPVVPRPLPEVPAEARPPEGRDPVGQAEDLTEMGNYGAAAAKLRSWLASGGRRERERELSALRLLANLEFALGDGPAAVQTAGRALKLAPGDTQLLALREDIAAKSRSLAGQTRYSVWRKAGSAYALRGGVGVLHVFVYGRGSERWTYRRTVRVETDVSLADAWLAARAKEHGAADAPRFEHRWTALAEEPFWASTPFPVSDTPQSERAHWEAAVLERLGAGTFAEAFDRAFAGRRPRNRLVVFHVDAKATSYAMSHKSARYPAMDLESAVVMFGLDSAFDFSHPPAYAHELIHTFGADDLYNKAEDRLVARSDVMNGGCRPLSTCTVSDLTAYAVGWRERRPPLSRLKIWALY
jgi:hypothetical protein